MDKHLDNEEFDAIIVGSGPGGATVARELSNRKKRVLMILERGGNAPLKEGFLTTPALLKNVSVGDKLATTRALTTGGTAAVYFAVAHFPPLKTFRSLGIDLSNALQKRQNGNCRWRYYPVSWSVRRPSGCAKARCNWDTPGKRG